MGGATQAEPSAASGGDGTAIDVPATAPSPRRRRSWPGPWQLVLTLVAATLALWAASVPGGAFDAGLGAAAAALAALVWWLGALAFRFGQLRRGRPRVGAVLGWLAAPAVVVATALLVWQDAPLRTGFAMSRGGFDRALASAPAAGERDVRVRRVGLYEAWVSRDASGTWFHVGGWLFSDSGFAHLDGDPPAGLTRFTPLGGGWYAFDGPDDFAD